MVEELAVLLVEDNQADAFCIQEFLNTPNPFQCEIKLCSSLKSAQQAVEQQHYDAILLDLSLPDSYGISTLEQMLERVESQIPIVITTAYDDLNTGIQAVNRGAQDYLIKGRFSADELARSLMHSLERHRQLNAVRVEKEQDALTALLTREPLERELERVCAGSLDESCYLIFIDLDHFKDLNDELGHLAGDVALQRAATCIQSRFMEPNLVARFGGDEFVLLVRNMSRQQLAQELEKLLHLLSKTTPIYEHAVSLSASMGIAPYRAGDNISTWMQRADEAMYAAKKGGRGRWAWAGCPVEEKPGYVCRVRQSDNLSERLNLDRIQLRYAPVFAQSDHALFGLEVLFSWRDHTGVSLSPDLFMTLADDLGRMPELCSVMFSQLRQELQADENLQELRYFLHPPRQLLRNSNIWESWQLILRALRVPFKQVHLALSPAWLKYPNQIKQLQQAGFQLYGFRMGPEDVRQAVPLGLKAFHLWPAEICQLDAKEAIYWLSELERQGLQIMLNASQRDILGGEIACHLIRAKVFDSTQSLQQLKNWLH